MKNKTLRIAHICLASSYTEGMLYQDNVLPDINREDGHEVLVVSNCACYIDGKLTNTTTTDKILQNGVRLVRLNLFGNWLPELIKNRIRYAPDLLDLLKEFKPDVILHHSVSGLSLLTVAKYKKLHPETRLYLDSHADKNNSAKSIISRWLQYNIFNRYLWRYISKSVDKVFYVSSESADFLKEIYKIREDQMEFFPLGGFVLNEVERKNIRHLIRKELLISEDSIVFVHSGKLNVSKRTLELMRAFTATSYENYRLLIVGVFEDDIAEEAFKIMLNDNRIVYLGWKSGTDLVNILAACDCYVQPGSQSATLQTAICCGLPIIIFPHSSHFAYMNNNGIFVRTSEEIEKALDYFRDPKNISAMSTASLEIGRNLLDYRLLAKRLYS